MPIKERTYTVSSYRVVCDKCGYDTTEYDQFTVAVEKAKKYGFAEVKPGVWLCADCKAENVAEQEG